MKQEFLMKAFVFDQNKHSAAGWYASEKLNFQRAFWDGGITRGMPKAEVPWANTSKDSRFVEEQVCTGLWTMNANVIHAPDWWLDRMPRVLLDGELGSLRGFDVAERQRVSSIIKKLTPGAGWEDIVLYAFDIPPLGIVFADRTINSPFYKKNLAGCVEWAYRDDMLWHRMDYSPYRNAYYMLNRLHLGDSCRVVEQELLPFTTGKALSRINELMFKVLAHKGEGLIIRHPDKAYETQRSKYILKYKHVQDMEGRIVAYTEGKGKYVGMMGAYVVEIITADPEKRQIKRVFELSGMDDAMRRNPLPIGTVITFQYSGISEGGIPQEARFLCVREPE
jgi:DNA ligase-1